MSEHGTHAKYCGGCRCQPCRDAHADYVYQNRTGRHRSEKGTYRQHKCAARIIAQEQEEKQSARIELYTIAAQLENAAIRLEKTKRLVGLTNRTFDIVAEVRRIASYI